MRNENDKRLKLLVLPFHVCPISLMLRSALHCAYDFRYWLLTLAALSAPPLAAQHRSMSVDDVLAIERLERSSVSPDGSLVAAVVLRPALQGEIFGRAAYEVDPSRADVWVIDRANGAHRNLTNGQSRGAGAWCATWSPDGQRLAFLSTRPEATEPDGGDNVRLYVWDRRTDELRRLSEQAVVTQTRYGGGLNRLDMAGPNSVSPDACLGGDENPPFVWLDARNLLVAFLPSGRTSALLDASERVYRHTEETRKAIRGGSDALTSVSGSGSERTSADPDEVAILSIGNIEKNSWTNVASVPIYPFNGALGVRVSPDGRRAAVLATIGAIPPRTGIPWAMNDGDWMVEKRLGFIDLVEVKPVKWVALPASAQLPVALDGWNDDNLHVKFTARAEPESKTAVRFSADIASGNVVPVPASSETSATPRPVGLPREAKLITSDSRGLVWSETTPEGVFIKAAQPDGKRPIVLLALNRHLASVDLGRIIEFDYAGEGGQPLKAAVLLPPNYRDGERLPVITWVYGGATVPGWETYSFDPFMPGIYNLRLYAAQGFAMLLPSIPLKRDGKQNPLLALSPAVNPAIDKLVAMGIADPTRVGVMGQSLGGYTALGLAAQSDRFRAVVAIAPLSDLTAFYGAFDPTARDYPGIEHEKSANAMIAELASPGLHIPPYVDPDIYQRNSPLTFVHRVTAPVLLIHGERDIRGTSYQSEAFFTGLWRQGKTARIMRYWGEDHALAASPATVRSVVVAITEWFDKYLAPQPSKDHRQSENAAN